uniref:UDENN FLCN/SMCR8-type domain-containing protein n=1 Tax=Ascaris lumbricoides TaxID=6252 RepID=A0A9J2Q0E9_ASCLU
MDAEEFWSVYEAVEDSTRTLQLTIRDPCAISKVVWSSFDYMNGPELCFVWEPIAVSSLSPVEFASNSDCSKDTTNSLTSSVSKATSTNTYEDIDNAFNDDLLTCTIAEMDVCAICSRMHPGVLCDSMISSSTLSRSESAGQRSRNDGLHYLDEFMSESRSTLGARTNTTVEDDEQARLMTSFASTSELEESQSADSTSGNDEDDGKGGESRITIDQEEVLAQYSLQIPADSNITRPDEMTEAIAFGVDVLLARNECFPNTPQDLSMLLMTEARLDEPNKEGKEGVFFERAPSNVDSTSTNTVMLTHSPSFSNVSDEGAVAGETVSKRGTDGTDETQQAMFSSAVDSGITGTISTHSDLSVQSPLMDIRNAVEMSTSQKADEGYVEEERTLTDDSLGFDEVADYEVFEAMCGENTLEVSDEMFIAKSVLAEQICSTQLPSNPLHHKLTIVPKRDLVAGSFMFPVVCAGGARRAMCALSLLTHQSKLDWYLQRQSTIESMVSDMLPRVKALHLVESTHDVIFRVMGEVVKMLSVLGAAERFPLYTSLDEIKLRRTYLMDSNLGDNVFLARAITALLRSQAHCVLIGDHKTDVAKAKRIVKFLQMLNTLSLFVAEEWRWSCLKAYAHSYSPYLRLQAVCRSELTEMMSLGVESEWPISVIDLDKRIVCVSSRFPKHCRLKAQRQREEAAAILHQDIDASKQFINSSMKLEMRGCHADSRVIEFLSHLDLLPREQSIRIGFVRQFLLSLENRAKAFIMYVNDASKPRDGDKQHATSGKWSLSAARKALDLFSETSFAIVLAEAERLQPDIAQFIYDSKCI